MDGLGCCDVQVFAFGSFADHWYSQGCGDFDPVLQTEVEAHARHLCYETVPACIPYYITLLLHFAPIPGTFIFDGASINFGSAVSVVRSCSQLCIAVIRVVHA